MRVIELRLNHGCLRAHCDGCGRLAARVAARSCGQNGQQHRTEREREVAALSFDHACDVALRDVADFVADDARELALVARGDDRGRMYGNEAAGERKRVERVVADREKEKVVGARFGVAHELIAEVVQVFRDFRIRHEGRIRANGIHELCA